MATLPFSTKFKDGTPTFFIIKIWESLALKNDFNSSEFIHYRDAYKLKFGHPWSILFKSYHPKHHTIRQDEKNLWVPGRKIHMVVFNRTKNRFQFAPVLEVKSVQKIEIIRTSDYLNETIVKVDNRQLQQKEVQLLAWNDGFDNLIDFWLWFSGGFTGKIIHWTNLKY